MMGFYQMFDPLYWMLVGPAMLLAIYAQFKVKGAFNKYKKQANSTGFTGAQAAAEMLTRQGVGDCRIEMTKGLLSDHYDPTAKTLRLSPDVYNGRSVAAVGIACHEAGHALQHANGYSMLGLRSMLVPITNISSKAALPLLFIGMILGMFGLAKIGVILFGVTVVFQLVTLPVEFNASSRAKAALVQNNIITLPEEINGVNSVLNAAAMTYVAATIAALAQLLYYAIRLGLIGGGDD
jgi:hypothetical protein